MFSEQNLETPFYLFTYFLGLIAKKKSTIGKHYKIFPTFCLYVVLEPVCCKKQQKKILTSFWFAE